MNLPEQRRYGRAYLRWFRLRTRRAQRLALRWLSLIKDGVLLSLERVGIERTLFRVDDLVRLAGIRDLFTRMYQNALPEAAQREFDRLRELLPTTAVGISADAGFFSQMWQQTTMRMLSDAETAARITRITEATRGQIRRILLQATVERLDVRQTARRMRMVLGGKGARTRALLIARTETTRAANAGHEAGALSTSLRLDKLWIATADTRTRTGHRAMLGKKPIPRDDMFVVNGVKMRYPGDPAGGVANCVNCRCVVSYVPAKR